MDRQIRNEKCAEEIINFLKENELFNDVNIYYNGKCVNEEGVTEGKKGSEYFDYANDETISISFEGGFYMIMNGHSQGSARIEEEFYDICSKYGYYYELGNAWNLSLYDN